MLLKPYESAWTGSPFEMEELDIAKKRLCVLSAKPWSVVKPRCSH